MSSTPHHDAAASGATARSVARSSTWSGVDHANVMSIELLAAILTWTGIGWLVDRWLGTPPWFLVIGALVGNFAGLYLIWLRAQRMDADDARRDAALEAERRALRAAAKLPTEHRPGSARRATATSAPATSAPATSAPATPAPVTPALEGSEVARP